MKWKDKEHLEITFPLIEDIRMEIAHRYGMIQPGASTTQAVRAVFVIDPSAKVRAILYYPLSTGRNFDEIKRLVQALQKADADQCATPPTGVPATTVTIPTAGSCWHRSGTDGKSIGDQYCLDWFLCFRREHS